MKLLRFSKGNKTLHGVLKKTKVAQVDDILKKEPTLSENYHELTDIRILPPVSPSKVVCVGLNYRDHAQELDMRIPEEPIIFLKPPTSVIGHRDHIQYPPSSKHVDYEAEMAIIIGKSAHMISEKKALEHVAGYTILNDITARDLQQKDGQWTRAKSFDTFCPLGPYIETDLNPEKQKISLKVNNKTKQESNTSNMIFSVPELIEFISNIMTLNVGDVIATGTPPGVGPLQIGDNVQIKVQDVGILENTVK